MRWLLAALLLFMGTRSASAQTAAFLPHPVVPAWHHLLRSDRTGDVPLFSVAPYFDARAIGGGSTYDRLGLFCKAEYHLHRWLPIPVLIRIGDVERDEEVDGKGAYGRSW